MIYNFTDRSMKLADERLHDKNIKIIKFLLIDKNYPLELINKHTYQKKTY